MLAAGSRQMLVGYRGRFAVANPLKATGNGGVWCQAYGVTEDVSVRILSISYGDDTIRHGHETDVLALNIAR